MTLEKLDELSQIRGEIERIDEILELATRFPQNLTSGIQYYSTQNNSIEFKPLYDRKLLEMFLKNVKERMEEFIEIIKEA